MFRAYKYQLEVSFLYAFAFFTMSTASFDRFWAPEVVPQTKF